MFENKILLDHESRITRFKQYKIAPLESGDFMVGPGESLEIEESQINTNGIAYAFGRISTNEAIIDFTAKYGLLGLHPANLFIKEDHYTYLKHFALHRMPIGAESVSEWKVHANHVRKLLRLYRNMTEGLPIEDDLIRVDQLHIGDPTFGQAFYAALQSSWGNDHYAWGNRNILQMENLRIANETLSGALKVKSKQPQKPFGAPVSHYFWTDGLPTLIPYTELIPVTDEGYHIIAKIVLMNHLEEMLKYSVYIDFLHVYNSLPLKAAAELKFVDRKATSYLLTAIYYDVWRIVNSHERVEFCNSCGSPFPVRRQGAVFCDQACKQRAWRKSKKNNVKGDL